MVDLNAHALDYEYPGPVRAVAGVDLHLGGDELVCILGPNGSGKSTLLRLLAGVSAPQSGHVELNGRRLDQFTARERARKVALVPQSLSAVPAISLRNFVLGGRYGHLDRWRRCDANDIATVERALASADMAGQGERLLTEISGGQRQRVMIARALAQEAEVLLVDEPTNSLDPGHQLSVFELIADQVRTGHGVLVVTHDLNLASQFATRLVLMDQGSIRAQGSAEEVLRPEVLAPVYGNTLRFGEWPGIDGGIPRPYALPWRRGQSL
ncbi:MAG: iron complex transport system ATP-binding protein [Chlamydiales bacterium]|jgi:iron complex transport system ATP-binding protein